MVASLWAVATLVGLALVVWLPVIPPGASREARVSDHAFTVLLLAAVPVFALVQVLLVYSVLRFRAGDDADGPPIAGNRALSVGWVTVTLALTLGLAAFGWMGMEEMRGHGGQHGAEEELRVKVVGRQFGWSFEYVDLGFTATELRLPKDRRVRFEITSTDVVHSFWIPPFRVKQDAVPGRTTYATVTPTALVRAKAPCAELCGVGHTVMTAWVEVLEPAAFEAWVAQQKAPGPR